MAIIRAPMVGANANRQRPRSALGRKTRNWPARNLDQELARRLDKKDTKGVQGKKTQSCKRQTAMSTRKASPSFLENMLVCLRANTDCQKFMIWSTPLRPASAD